MEIFLEYTETAFCLQFIFYEVEGLCQDKCKCSPPLAIGVWSTSLHSALALSSPPLLGPEAGTWGL